MNPRKTIDVVALSNLCLDIVVEVDQVPSQDAAIRKALLSSLTASPPPQSAWELGGNCNFLIAASRIGLKAVSLGCLGSDSYGNFLSSVLLQEGVHLLPILAEDTPPSPPPPPQQQQQLFSTLLCFVLVAPETQTHTFCSSYDFGPWPLLPRMGHLPSDAQSALANTSCLFINGFAFDDLPPEIVVTSAREARESGAAVFFDPGPRSWTFVAHHNDENENENNNNRGLDNRDRQQAFEELLNVTDVILMTEEEAEAVTGQSTPEQAAKWVLQRPKSVMSWCIIKQGGNGALLATNNSNNSRSNIGDGISFYYQPAVNVDVKDTVGCGDSFAAAIVLGFTQGHGINSVLALGNAVGAATAMAMGAGRNVAAAETVEQLLKSQIEELNNEGGDREVSAAAREALDILQASLRQKK
jgi:sugar/nucleoside kinase (ribokinase family)